MRTRVFAVAAAAFALSQGAAHAATVIVEPPSGFSCGAAGCVDAKTHGFSQALNLSGFSGPITISGLSFDRSLLGKFGNAMLHVTFWTNNGQTLVDDFGLYLAAVLGGDTLTLNGHMFVWDATNSDLSFKIEIENWNNREGGGSGGFGGGGSGGAPNHDPHHDDDDGGHDGGHSSFQLVQNDGGWNGDPSPAPEPASWALMIAGFGGLGAVARTRRRAPAPVRG